MCLVCLTDTELHSVSVKQTEHTEHLNSGQYIACCISLTSVLQHMNGVRYKPLCRSVQLPANSAKNLTTAKMSHRPQATVDMRQTGTLTARAGRARTWQPARLPQPRTPSAAPSPPLATSPQSVRAQLPNPGAVPWPARSTSRRRQAQAQPAKRARPAAKSRHSVMAGALQKR